MVRVAVQRGPELPPALASLRRTVLRIRFRWRALLDRSVAYPQRRWIVLGVLLVSFAARVLIAQGWYIVAYAHAIYMLNLFLLFLTPRFDPGAGGPDSLDDDPLGSVEGGLDSDEDQFAPGRAPGGSDNHNGGGSSSSSSNSNNNGNESSPKASFLPTRHDDEFRPFIRRLPEFKFWLNGTLATSAALLTTCFDALDVPVFWPILLVYFILLFYLTMRRQIAHMIAYRYLPFDLGKKRYKGGKGSIPASSSATAGTSSSSYMARGAYGAAYGSGYAAGTSSSAASGTPAATTTSSFSVIPPPPLYPAKNGGGNSH